MQATWPVPAADDCLHPAVDAVASPLQTNKPESRFSGVVKQKFLGYGTMTLL